MGNSLQPDTAPVNPNGAALAALERWMIARGTYDAQAQADIKRAIILTRALPTDLIGPEDLADAQTIWRAAPWFATGTAATAGLGVHPIPWADFKTELLRLYQPPLLSRASRNGMKCALRRVDAMDVHSTAELVPALIADLVAREPAKNSPNTTLGILRCLRTACHYAESLGYLRISPFRVRALSTYVKSAPARGRKHASREEIRRVLDHMKQQTEADGWRGWKAKRLYALTACLAYTGARAGEIYFLQTQDVDLDEGIIWIVSRKEHKTKTESAARPLPMAPNLIPIVREWLPHRMSAPPNFRIDDPHCPWLFPTTRRHGHTPWHGGSGAPGTKPRDRMKAVAAQVGVIGFGPLVLRHSMATHLITSWGGSPGLVKRVLRHTTEQTQEWYVHDDLPGLKEAFKRVEF